MLHWTEWSGEDELIVHPRTLIVYDVDDNNNDSLSSYQKLTQFEFFIINVKNGYRNNSIKNVKKQKKIQ